MTTQTQDSILRRTRWLALGLFVGVILAELLSSFVSPVIAWLVGGAVIGCVPTGDEASGSTLRRLLTVACTACVAAVARWLAGLMTLV